MAELGKLMCHIQETDLKIAAMTKEIKEMESEVKRIENEIATLRIIEKQLEQDNKYKAKVLFDKECELKIFQRQYEIWEEMLGKKLVTKKGEEKLVDKMKETVWDTRTKFCEDVSNFLENNDCLIYGTRKIQEALMTTEEQYKIQRELNILEYEVAKLEIEKAKLNEEWKSLESLELTRQEVSREPETSPIFLSLKKDLREKLRELEEIELKFQLLYKLENDKRCMTPSSFFPLTINQSPKLQMSMQDCTTIFHNQNIHYVEDVQGHVPCFIPKFPSQRTQNRRILTEKDMNTDIL